MSAEDIKQAVLALYNTHQPADRERANQYLMQFAESESAWIVSLELLTTCPIPEVQYFSANVLYSKVCRDWLQLQNQGDISRLSVELLAFLHRSAAAAATGIDRIVLLRVCLAAAALAIKLQDGLAMVLQESYRFLGGSPDGVATAPPGSLLVGLSLIKCLPEEAEKVDMSRSRRDEIEGTLRDCAPNIMRVVEAVLHHRQEHSQPALEALESWLTVGFTTLTSLYRDSPQLFHSLASVIAAPETLPREVVIATSTLFNKLAGWNDYPRPAGRDAAVQKLFEAIFAGTPKVVRPGAGELLGEDVAHAYCSFVVELAKAEATAISRAEGHSMGMVEVLLLLTAHENIHISTLALEFWEELRNEPVSKRDPRLRRPLSAQLAQLLTQRLCYPPTFTSWEEEVNMDEEDFNRFREGDMMKELLESCYQSLRSEYFVQLRQRLEAQGGSWQVQEVVLLMMQEVSRAVLTYLESTGRAVAASPEVTHDQQITVRALLELLHQYLSVPTQTHPPLVLRALLRLLASYTPLMAPPPNSRLRGLLADNDARQLQQLSLQCCVHGLSHQSSGPPAAAALRVLCVNTAAVSAKERVNGSNGGLWTSSEAVEMLMGAPMGSAAAGLEIAHQLVVVEAVVRTLVSLQPEHARHLLNHFTTPLMDNLGAALNEACAGRAAPQVLRNVSELLQMLGQTVRFLDVPVSSAGGSDGPHIASDLVASLWPLLERCRVFTRHADVMDHVYAVYKYMVVGLRPLVAPHLRQLLATVVELFESTAHEGALQTAMSIAEIFRHTDTAGQGTAPFSAFLSALSRATFAYMQAGHPPTECPALVVAFYDMILRFLTFQPSVLYASPEFPTMLDLAVVCLQTPERESTRSVLKVLRELVRHLSDGPQEEYVLGAVRLLEERGQVLVRVTLAAMAGRAPSTLWINYFDFFHSLLAAWPSLSPQGLAGCMAWVHAAVFDADVIGPVVSAENRQLLVELIARLSQENRQRMKLLLDDLSKICTSEMDPDSLKGYQMLPLAGPWSRWHLAHAWGSMSLLLRLATVSSTAYSPSCFQSVLRTWGGTGRAWMARRTPQCRGLVQMNSAVATKKPSVASGVGSYGADKITVLEGLEPVRKRPGMYIGSTGVKGLHHLIFEVVDNSVDEALAGYCTQVDVVLEGDGSVTVKDNGRGIPCEVHPRTGKSALETVLTVLHAGGKFGGEASGYKVSGGLHGVGVSVVNALSDRLDVTVKRDGKVNHMAFSRGIRVGDLRVLDDTEGTETGTTVRFKPDPEIFKTTTDFEFDRVASRLDELAYLNAGVKLALVDKRAAEVKRRDFLHQGGIKEYVTLMCEGKEKLHPEVEIIHATGEKNGVSVEVAMRWNKDQYDDMLISFANGIRTGDGGTHLDGLKAVLTRTINALARKSGKLKEGKDNLTGDFVREGLTAIVSVKVPEPEFEGQTKNRLGNPEVRSIVDSVVGDALVNTFEWNPKVLGAIVDKAMSAQAAAQAAKAARDMVRRKSLLSTTVLPGKLADCSSRDPADSEIYIVEGDSAAGSAKQGRDRRTQAILPLRGKILNIEKAATEKIYQNAELQALISALGLGIQRNELDVAALRYHRIVIMTDADVDGAHIRILLLTFLFRYQRALIENGYIYIACPPLYKVSQGKITKYAYTQEELEAVQASMPKGKGGLSLQRFKGLGEMMPQQLWETTMNPATRILKQVTVEDAAEADHLFSLLMGDAVGPRKDFINRHAEQLQLADLDF